MIFNYKWEENNEITIFHLSGDLLSKAAGKDFVDSFEQKLAENKKNIILNLNNMSYLNSIGLSIFIGLLTKIRNAGGELVIFNIPNKINQLLLITKLNTVFNVANSLDEAVKLLK